MTESGKVAVARFVLRNKEHLAAIRPMNGILTLATMRFSDEVVPPDEIEELGDGETPKPKQRELEMARSLIDSLSSDFEAEKYRDEYREELLSLIERKAEGKEVVVKEGEEPEPTKAPDLMAALEESLAAVKGEELGKGAKGDGAGKRKKPAAKRKSPSKSRSKSKAKS
jgi:DNA end-binding protein Ku